MRGFRGYKIMTLFCRAPRRRQDSYIEAQARENGNVAKKRRICRA